MFKIGDIVRVKKIECLNVPESLHNRELKVLVVVNGANQMIGFNVNYAGWYSTRFELVKPGSPPSEIDLIKEIGYKRKLDAKKNPYTF